MLEPLKSACKRLFRATLRRVIEAMNGRPTRRGGYQTPGSDLGVCSLLSLDNVEEALAQAEGEHHK
jgi:hypothetical protein